MIERDLSLFLRQAAKSFPVVAVTGPRQSGKSTLCRALFPKYRYASLESPDTRRFAAEDPRGFLAGFPDGAILDEVQNSPDILSSLQKIAAELEGIKNCRSYLIYGGNVRQNRTSATALPWNHVDKHHWT